MLHAGSRTPRTAVRFAAVAALAAALPFAAVAAPAAKAGKDWKSAAKKLRAADLAAVKADWLLAQARAIGIEDDEEREEFLEEAREEYLEEKGIAKDRMKARLDLAAALGEETLYTAAIDPADFVGFIDNPRLPLVPGNLWIYEAETEEGTETIEVEVLFETVEILGVTCTVVRDTVTIDGERVEDTRDWFAQDVDGNVWYFGEISLNYEDGSLVDVDGSWEAGKDGAHAGIVMPAAPAVGDLYRQEFLLGEAEDYGEVLALAETATVPAGTFNGCLKTFDGTPMEPDAEEHKYYAPGIGMVLEEKPEDGERVELVFFSGLL